MAIPAVARQINKLTIRLGDMIRNHLPFSGNLSVTLNNDLSSHPTRQSCRNSGSEKLDSNDSNKVNYHRYLLFEIRTTFSASVKLQDRFVHLVSIQAQASDNGLRLF